MPADDPGPDFGPMLVVTVTTRRPPGGMGFRPVRVERKKSKKRKKRRK